MTASSQFNDDFPFILEMVGHWKPLFVTQKVRKMGAYEHLPTQVTIIRQSWHDVVISVPGSGSRPNNCGVELAVPLWRASGSSYKLYHAVTSNLYASITW